MTPRFIRQQVLPWLALQVLAGPLFAQTLATSQLADLSLEFAVVTAVSARPGSERLMRLDTLPGDRMRLELPFRPNRIEWLVSDGSSVGDGQAIARVYGPELEHWLLEVAMLEERLAEAHSRYTRNKRLYEQQSLSPERWQSIVEYYHSLRLEHQHMSHVLEWLDADTAAGTGNSEDAAESVVLRSPQAGLVLIAAVNSETVIAELVDVQALRLTAQIPQSASETVIALRVNDCDVPLARDDSRVSGFTRRLWSEPAATCVAPRLGLRLSGVPVYRFSGYAVPRDAIVGVEGHTYLALESAAGIELAAIRIAGEDRRRFYVSSERSLAGARTLVRSTSAVQGLLLGLGKD